MNTPSTLAAELRAEAARLGWGSQNILERTADRLDALAREGGDWCAVRSVLARIESFKASGGGSGVALAAMEQWAYDLRKATPPPTGDA